jgi:hypothetical protein
VPLARLQRQPRLGEAAAQRADRGERAVRRLRPHDDVPAHRLAGADRDRVRDRREVRVERAVAEPVQDGPDGGVARRGDLREVQRLRRHGALPDAEVVDGDGRHAAVGVPSRLAVVGVAVDLEVEVVPAVAAAGEQEEDGVATDLLRQVGGDGDGAAPVEVDPAVHAAARHAAITTRPG